MTATLQPAYLALNLLKRESCVVCDNSKPLEPWDDGQDQGMDGEKSFAQRRDHRASTHTVHSIASTVLTRASNIIQIAYIPGVTNRATASPTVLVPPVPPIPIAVSQAGTPASTEDQHFFVPGDLRDSTYSGLSSFSDRTSYARTSYAPRSSVASTIYGKSAVVVAPAQTGMRAKPAMVSVRSAHSNTSNGTSTPPVPAVDYEKYNSVRPPSPANSTFSVGSTFLNNASTATATPARAMVVRVGSVKKIGANKQPKPAPDADSVASPTVSGSTIRDSAAATIIVDSPADEGPFSDPPKSATQSTTSLSAVIEEATRRASQRDSTVPEKGRQRSPFGDEHASS
ncbi:7e9c629b-fbcd-46b8-9d33-b3bce566b57e [Thermothielavioides terrestris]|uniref:7e9c629b-fbcd-46b8-9d33-b3bce566b57e n=1 Tax=Thermothielavioides terrestris TaxID=2587410 RepID=A0A446BI65_9PEZI|nr:7e9c629b-fbcd-46b8-9d33-b3bce566b57e [Thermothielavioides terrestris]